MYVKMKHRYLCKTYADTEKYISLTNSFKSRFNSHKTSFHRANNKHATELSKYMYMELENNSANHTLHCNILNLTLTSLKKCSLSNTENFYIMYRQQNATLNKNVRL